jgi:hypothetical protein
MGETILADWSMALAGAILQTHGQNSNGTTVFEALPKQTLKRKSLDPTSDLKQFQSSNRFIPSTHDVDGYSKILSARIINSIKSDTDCLSPCPIEWWLLLWS